MRIFALLLLVPLVALAEPATVIRATDLKQEPASDSATVAALPENTSVEALERKGGWTRVKAASGEGWVRMLALRFGGATAPKPGASGLTQMFNVARTGTSGTQVTTGVRGLDAEQLATAQPNPAELARLEKFAADRDAAASFAAQGKLDAKSVDYPKP
ncbi:MAG TPA: SH3 domain-containing protein [Burkholderiales bacterium]|nr:SH3 domain-containing protein [Burkholderiales bacterium]